MTPAAHRIGPCLLSFYTLTELIHKIESERTGVFMLRGGELGFSSLRRALVANKTNSVGTRPEGSNATLQTVA
jgi:hypothetical protein